MFEGIEKALRDNKDFYLKIYLTPSGDFAAIIRGPHDRYRMRKKNYHVGEDCETIEGAIKDLDRFIIE